MTKFFRLYLKRRSESGRDGSSLCSAVQATRQEGGYEGSQGLHWPFSKFSSLIQDEYLAILLASFLQLFYKHTKYDKA